MSRLEASDRAGAVNGATAAAPSGGGTARDTTLPIRFSGGPQRFLQRHAPLLGEHTRKVLAELGFTEEELDEAEGVRDRTGAPTRTECMAGRARCLRLRTILLSGHGSIGSKWAGRTRLVG